MNEHHQNGYGLMPSPNLIAAALARSTRDAALVVMGNSLARSTTRPCASPKRWVEALVLAEATLAFLG